MATQYTLTSSFSVITEDKGTVQNTGIESVELASTINATAGEGIVLLPGETRSFKGAISARSMGDNSAKINVVDFIEAGEGGDYTPMYVPVGSVAFASLPATLTKAMVGWTYNVTDAFTTDSRFVEGAGIDYPAGQNVVVVEPSTGVYKLDCFAGAYVLPVAGTTILGGVKSDTTDGKIKVENDGTMTMNLPTATTAIKGGIKVGTGLEMTSDTLSVDIATDSVIGGVKSDTTEGKVTVNNNGTMTYNPLGYRQPSTAYTAGQIAYHSALPTGYYLECTTTGISGSGALTISTTTVGTTVSDGTVVWTIRQGASTTDLSGYLPLAGGTVSGDLIVTGTINGTSSSMTGRLNLGGLYLQDFELKRNNNTSRLALSGGNQSAYINLYGKECTETNNQSAFAICAHNGTNSKVLVGKLDGSLLWDGNDLAGSAIVAKSLGANGYIKYASGLIVQWGQASANGTNVTAGTDSGTYKQTVALPLSYTSSYKAFASINLTGYNAWAQACIINNNSIDLTATRNSDTNISWFTIGY